MTSMDYKLSDSLFTYMNQCTISSEKSNTFLHSSMGFVNKCMKIRLLHM